MSDEGIARVLRRFPNGRPWFMLVSDLDHTMVQNEDPTHDRQLRFNAEWQRSLAPRSLLVWSTGRSPALFRALWNEAPLLSPDVLVCSVGSEIFYRDPTTGAYAEDAGWARVLIAGGRWKRGEAEAAAAAVPALVPQPTSEQRPHKLSFRAPPGEAGRAAVKALRAALDARGLTEDVAKVVHSGGADVDVLAAGAGKGGALEAVRAALLAALLGGEQQQQQQQQLPPEMAPPPPPPLPLGIQVNGDSGNDAELFEVPGARGCIVANAHAELLEYHARRVAREAAAEAAAAAAAGGAAAGDEGGGASGGGSGRAAIHLASEPCCGGILETLRLFQTAHGVARLEAAELGADKAEELLRAREVVLAFIGTGGYGAEGATAARADGRVVPLREWARGADVVGTDDTISYQSIDQLRTRHAGEGVVLATFERWWWGGWCSGDEEEGSRATGGPATEDAIAAATLRGGGRRRACLMTAVLRRRPGPGCDMEVVHVHEGPPVVATNAMERLGELVAAGY